MGAVKSVLLALQEARVMLPDPEFTGEYCRECGGDGWVESLAYGRGAGPEMLEPIYEQFDCPECGGSGFEHREERTPSPFDVYPSAPPSLPLAAYESEETR